MTRYRAFLAAPLMLLGLAACEPVPATGGTGGTGSTGGAASTPRSNVPESVASIAAPYQDLGSARVRPEDGCYWYTHRGPVETTQLPLRTAAGNPICTRQPG